MFNLPTSLVLWSLALAVLADTEESRGTEGIAKRDISDVNIAFDLPDLTAIYRTTSGTFHLEAFKSVKNDQILRDRDSSSGKTEVPSKISQLIWVSVGQPVLMKTANPSKPKSVEIFHSSTYEFYSYIQMLTPAQIRLLSTTASKKYQVKVEESQIVNLILSKFECSLRMYDEIGHKYILKGNVYDFRHFPLRINFEASPRSMERKLFVQMLQDESDLNFKCTMASTGKLMKTNTLTISAQQQQMLDIEEKIFGGSTTNKSRDQVYVTRDQMTKLSSEMYSTLNIVEDYQMSESQFNDAFVEGMINQIATEQFKQVPIDTVLASISKYGFDIGQDLKPDVIKKDMGTIVIIKKENDTSRIVLDEVNYKKLEESNPNYGGGNFMGFGASADWARSNSKSDAAKTKSVNEQVEELNSLSKDVVKWEIEGDRVVPKSLNVARVSKTKLGKTLSFSRVRVKSYSAPFERQFALHTNRAAAFVSAPDPTSSRITALEADVKKMKTNLTASIQSVNNQLSSIKAINNQMKLSIQALSAPDLGNISKQLQELSTNLQNLKSSHLKLSSAALKRCRLCFVETSGNSQCRGIRNSCSPLTDYKNNGGWTKPFMDATEGRNGWCTYQWSINCFV